MACQKACKQCRDDIIVNVNLQCPIPTSLYITIANSCENDAGMRLCKFTVSSLPCLHALWHAIPTSFLTFFKPCHIFCSRLLYYPCNFLLDCKASITQCEHQIFELGSEESFGMRK